MPPRVTADPDPPVWAPEADGWDATEWGQDDGRDPSLYSAPPEWPTLVEDGGR
jgi:hypothetical protein